MYFELELFACAFEQKGEKGDQGRVGIAGMPGLPGTPVSIMIPTHPFKAVMMTA